MKRCSREGSNPDHGHPPANTPGHDGSPGSAPPLMWSRGGCQTVSMLPSVRSVHAQVEAILPLDDLEATHQADTLQWLERTDDVYRRAAPATPDRHLVAYFALIDPSDGSSLLVDHIKAGLYLPPGGHVEPNEQPVGTVQREAREELGIEAHFAADPPRPAFVTVTETIGTDSGHTDVSLWFVLVGQRAMPLVADPAEFHAIRWWTPAEIRAADPASFDPHYQRFMAKIGL